MEVKICSFHNPPRRKYRSDQEVWHTYLMRKYRLRNKPVYSAAVCGTPEHSKPVPTAVVMQRNSRVFLIGLQGKAESCLSNWSTARNTAVEEANNNNYWAANRTQYL